MHNTLYVYVRRYVCARTRIYPYDYILLIQPVLLIIPSPNAWCVNESWIDYAYMVSSCEHKIIYTPQLIEQI